MALDYGSAQIFAERGRRGGVLSFPLGILALVPADEPPATPVEIVAPGPTVAIALRRGAAVTMRLHRIGVATQLRRINLEVK